MTALYKKKNHISCFVYIFENILKSNFDFERHFAIIGCSNVRINHWNIKHQARLTYCKFKSLDKVWDATKVVLTSPIAGKAKFHFSKINVGSVMSVMFVDIRPGALRSPESTEVHDIECIFWIIT